MDLLVACHPQMSTAHPPKSVPWVSTQIDEFRSSKIVRWQKFNGFEIRPWTFALMKFPASGGLPTYCAEHLPLILSTHRPWTCHPYDAVEPPTIRQIVDSLALNWIIIGVWWVGYKKHHIHISGSSAINQRFSWIKVFKTNKSEGAGLLVGECHVCNWNVTGTFDSW